MTRDDISFLLERATGFALLVLGLDALPDLLDAWIDVDSHEGGSTRFVALRTLVPLAAGGFLLLRRHPPSPAATAVPAAATIAPAMRRSDWLWVVLKALGAYALLTGLSGLVTLGAWATTGDTEGLLAQISGCIVWIAGGLWLVSTRRTFDEAREVPPAK